VSLHQRPWVRNAEPRWEDRSFADRLWFFGPAAGRTTSIAQTLPVTGFANVETTESPCGGEGDRCSSPVISIQGGYVNTTWSRQAAPSPLSLASTLTVVRASFPLVLFRELPGRRRSRLAEAQYSIAGEQEGRPAPAGISWSRRSSP